MKQIDNILNKCKELIDKYWYICLFVIFAVFLFSRVYKLADLPYGIHVDEQGAVLDGYYLSHYGYDRNMAHMPPHLMNYHNGQSSLYAYSVAIVLKFLPFSIFSVRLPAVLWGCVGFFFIFLLCRELFENDNAIALLGPVFFTIFPFIMSSERWGLDCNLYLPLAIVSLYFFILSIKTGRLGYYVLTGALMGFTLYSYALSYVVTIFFLIAMFIYTIYLKKFELKKWIAMGIPCFIFALPLILFQMVNMDILPDLNLLGIDIKRMITYRGDEVALKNIIANIKFIPKLLIGYDNLPYNAFDNTIAFGTVYIFMAPIIVAGFVIMTIDVVKGFKKKEFDKFAIIWLFFMCSMAVLMLVDGLSINNANQMYMTFIVFAIYCIVKMSGKWSITTPIVLAVSAIFFLCYSKFYFMDQNDVYGKNIIYFYGTQAYEIVNYAEKTYNPNGDKHVYFEEQYEDQGAEVFLLSALKDVPPWEFDYDRTEFGNVSLHFPEEFKENENAIYILGYNWNFIADYLISIGFSADLRYENYYILYR